MLRSRIVRWLLLVASGLVLPACYTFRSADADRTNWDELPVDPRPELRASGSPRLSIVLDGVYGALGDAEPALDAQATQYYLGVLRESGVFREVFGGDAGAEPTLPRVRMQRLYQEDGNTGANLAMAATVPGLLGYRFALVATLRLELEGADGAPRVYEARSRLTRIYHHAGNTDAARLFVYFEADRANTAAIVHQLQADASLFEPVGSAADTPTDAARRGATP